MIKPSITLQELRRRIYLKAKAERMWRFWGLYVHVCKIETLQAAYQEARANDGAPGLDGVSFESVEAQGVEKFLEGIQRELLARTYKPTKNRKGYFDNIRHHILLRKVAARVQDPEVLHLVKRMLKANGTRGVPQGGVIGQSCGGGGNDCLAPHHLLR